MNKCKKYLRLRSLLVLTICLLGVSNAFAAVSTRNYQLVSKELSQKIKADLSDEAATVELKKVEEYQISNEEIGLKGDAVCVTGENQMPIRFEVKINTPNLTISEINYDFIADISNYSPTSNEEVLMKELMSKISRDYKTTNIVIAIDNVEEVGLVNSEKKLLGVGEVRIGDMVWGNIKFDVSLDAATNQPKKVAYKIEK